MSHKPFKTIEELIEILKSRNVFIGDDSKAKQFLMRFGYYSIINAYKDPFLDKNESSKHHTDYYVNGTTFSDFQALFMFDEILRLITRRFLDISESILKNSSIYAFCYYHRECEAYLESSSYASWNDYYDKKNYERNLSKLISILQSSRDNKSLKKDYIQHYIDTYHEVPLWIIAQTLTFGNMSAFYDLQKPKIQNAICVNICEAINKPKHSIGIKNLRKDYKVLTEFRNICSHGERFYCAKVGRNKQYGFKDLLEAFRHVLPTEHEQQYISDIFEQLQEYENRSKIVRIVTDGLGVDKNTLRTLRSSSKNVL